MGFSASSLYLAGLVLAAPAYAQSPQDKPPPAKPSQDDIIVTGQHAEGTLNSAMPGEGAATSRGVSADAHQFARCLNGVSPKLQRSIVEGHPKDGATQAALDKLIRSNAGCYPRFRTPIDIGKNEFFGTCNPVTAGLTQGQQAGDFRSEMQICRAPYDRSALVEEAFLAYAPHFMLTRADTLNRDVIARFRAREQVRGKHRTPLDRRYYDTLSCMVQLEPETAIRLIRSRADGGDEERLRTQLLDKTKYCTGNARKVTVDPPQFRGYLADAVYHWTIAAKNVETLIPAS